MRGNNNTQLFNAIYKKYAKTIFRFIYLRVSNREIAQDITAETFVHVWKIIIKKIVIQNQKALLYVIARGKVVDYYRRKKNKSTIPIEGTENETHYSDSDLIESLSKKEELAIIYSKLRKLRHEYQEIIFLHYVEDLTISEIAAIIGKKENAVRVLLHRALASLRKKL